MAGNACGWRSAATAGGSGSASPSVVRRLEHPYSTEKRRHACATANLRDSLTGQQLFDRNAAASCTEQSPSRDKTWQAIRQEVQPLGAGLGTTIMGGLTDRNCPQYACLIHP